MTGFIPGSRATLMMDIVATAMLLVIPLLAFSIFLVRYKKNFQAHQLINKAIGLLLLVTVLLFETEVRIVGWRSFAQASRYYNHLLFPILYVHIVIAVVTSIAWIVTLGSAWRKFTSPVRPNDYSSSHRRQGRVTFVCSTLTTISGWTFYWMAFLS